MNKGEIHWLDPDTAVLILEDDGGNTFQGVRLVAETFSRDTRLFPDQPDWGYWVHVISQRKP